VYTTNINTAYIESVVENLRGLRFRNRSDVFLAIKLLITLRDELLKACRTFHPSADSTAVATRMAAAAGLLLTESEAEELVSSVLCDEVEDRFWDLAYEISVRIVKDLKRGKKSARIESATSVPARRASRSVSNP